MAVSAVAPAEAPASFPFATNKVLLAPVPAPEYLAVLAAGHAGLLAATQPGHALYGAVRFFYLPAFVLYSPPAVPPY